MVKRNRGCKIVTFGGGTGQFHLLSGLREVNDPEKITAVAGCWDSGGSSGRLRTEMGVLPPGDIRRCMLALITDEDQRMVAQRLFDDRLEDVTGPLKGHSFGNLLTARLDNIYRGQDRGINAERDLFRIRSKIMPVSLTNVQLIAETSKGAQIAGEKNIDLRAKEKNYDADNRIIRIYFDTRADANPEVIREIKKAEKIVFAPGDLYTSVLPHLLVEEVRAAIVDSHAKLYFVLNLLTKPGETDGYKASDFIKALVFYLDAPRRLNYVIANENHLDRETLKIYKEEGQNPVVIDEAEIKRIAPKAKIIKAGVSTYFKKDHLLRHDAVKLARAVLEKS
ncbi:MAG TPA: gluconeogenesis factor YvcK family protein [Patescibacteria group bacterium]|nr:gluconeogenesis factor YvcK family protein [Patescibacteria group bacterium]